MNRRDLLGAMALLPLTRVPMGGGKMGVAKPDQPVPEHSADLETHGQLVNIRAIELAEGKTASELLPEVSKEHLRVDDLRRMFHVESSERRTAMSILAWQSVLLSSLFMRSGAQHGSVVRYWTQQARIYGYHCGDLRAVAHAYDKEAIFELWYGDPQQAIRIASHGLYVIRNIRSEDARALLCVNIMRGYSAIGNRDAFLTAESQSLNAVEELPTNGRPSVFGMLPEQLWGARAISHGDMRSSDALSLHETGERSMLRNRSAIHLRRLQRMNKMRALASIDPHEAVRGTLAVLHSMGEGTEQVYRHRALWVLSAIPEAYGSAEKTELHRITHLGRNPSTDS